MELGSFHLSVCVLARSYHWEDWCYYKVIEMVYVCLCVWMLTRVVQTVTAAHRDL